MKKLGAYYFFGIGLFLMAALASEAAPLGIVADWTFNNTLTDSSGYGNNLTVLTGTASYGSGPFAGQHALVLNGDTELTTVSQTLPASMPSGNSPFTIALYLKAAPNSSLFAGLIGYGSNDTNRMESLRLGTADASSATSLTDFTWGDNTTVSLPTGQSFTNAWHSIVATYNGSVENIYLDGTLAGSQSGMHLNVGTNWLYVGGAVAAHDLTGSLADVTVANFAATASQVATYETTGQLPDPASVVATPEPGTLALMGLGATTLWRLRRRCK